MNYQKQLKNILRSSGNNSLTGFALISGLAAGAALAILLAPKSGRELRKDVTDHLEELSDDIQNLIVSVRSRFTAAGELAQEAIEDNTPAYVSQSIQKKPKSAIKELIHEAHIHAASEEKESQ